MDPDTGRRRSRWAVRALIALGVLSAVGATTAAGVDIGRHDAATTAPAAVTPSTSAPPPNPPTVSTPDNPPTAPQVLPGTGRSHTRSGGS